MVRERYAVHAIPTVETKGFDMLVVVIVYSLEGTYDLVLNGHDTEVDNLHRRPDQPVGFERRDVDVLKLALYSALASTLGYRHEGEETRKTCRVLATVQSLSAVP